MLQSYPQLEPAQAVKTSPRLLEVSIVIPCLNEENTIEICVRKALNALQDANIVGEVIVADNGSTDNSQELAQRAGARVIHVFERGYGAALRGGFAASQAKYIIMGDADNSYDFSVIEPFIARLREGYQLVMGTRLKGTILPGAMRPLHRYVGNPIITFLGNLFFGSNVSDFCCGLRAFDRVAIEQLHLATSGMETALEMIVKATMNGLTITNLPIIFHPDGRFRPPHLRTWTDGWRHLKFLLLLSPGWLYIRPGLALIALSCCGFIAALLNSSTSIPVVLCAMFSAIIGAQLLTFGGIARVIAVSSGLIPVHPSSQRLSDGLKMNAGLIGGTALSVVATLAIVFSPQFSSIYLLIFSLLLLALGIQLFFSSFLISLLDFKQQFK